MSKGDMLHPPEFDDALIARELSASCEGNIKLTAPSQVQLPS
jgi:hypothetical protein